MSDNTDTLAHAGVKGMKWGQKNSSPSDQLNKLLKNKAFVAEYKKITSVKGLTAKARQDKLRALILKYTKPKKSRGNTKAMAHEEGRDFIADIFESDEDLAHWGVLGMKWGVRKDRRTSGRSPGKTSATKKRKAPRKLSTEARQAQAIRKKHPSEMSNAELRALTTRLELETKYKKHNPTPIRRVENTVKGGTSFIQAFTGAVSAATALYALTKTPWGKVVIAKGQAFAKDFFSSPQASQATNIPLKMLQLTTGK